MLTCQHVTIAYFKHNFINSIIVGHILHNLIVCLIYIPSQCYDFINYPCQQCTSMGRLWDVTYVSGTSMGRKTKKNVFWAVTSAATADGLAQLQRQCYLLVWGIQM